MKRLLYYLLSTVIITSILTACSTSNDVVSNKTIQKRKYNKGYYASFVKKSKPLKAQELSQEESKLEEKPLYDFYDETTSLTPIEEKDFLVRPKVTNGTKPVISNKSESEKRNFDALILKNKIKEKDINTNKFISNTSEEDHEGDHGFLVILLLIILCFIIPPLAVILYEGPTTRFWLILILSLISIFSFVYPFAWISGVIAVIWSLLIVIGAV